MVLAGFMCYDGLSCEPFHLLLFLAIIHTYVESGIFILDNMNIVVNAAIELNSCAAAWCSLSMNSRGCCMYIGGTENI